MLVRIGLGVMFLADGVVLKLFSHGLRGAAAVFVAVGLPSWLAYVTFACELVGGELLVLGVQARGVVIALLPFRLGALFAVHLPKGWVFTSPNRGWGYPAYLFALCIARWLVGDGILALSSSHLLATFLDAIAPQKRGA